MLLLYSDGGPDHHVTSTNASVQITLIALFHALQLDYLLAARTCPSHRYRNMVKWCMSTLDLRQAGGLMLTVVNNEVVEKALAGANSTADIFRLAAKLSMQDDVTMSIQPVKDMLHDVFSRVQLHGKPVKVTMAASADNLAELRTEFISIDREVQQADTTKAQLQRYAHLKEFIAHSCKMCKYFFQIKKCGDVACRICGPPTLPPEKFILLQDFSDPIPSADHAHFKSLEEVWGAPTSEAHCRSLKLAEASTPAANTAKMAEKPSVRAATGHGTLPITAKKEIVRGVVICTECDKLRCVFAAKKLRVEQPEEAAPSLRLYLWCRAHSSWPCTCRSHRHKEWAHL